MRGLHRGFDRIEEDLAARERYQDYLRRIRVADVLAHYGAQNTHEEGDEIVHSCLLDKVDPHHANGDANPSALANIDSKLYLCRTSWGGDILQFIMRMEQTDRFADIVPLLSDMLDGSTIETPKFLEQLRSTFERGQAVEEPMPSFSDRVLRGWANIHPYVLERGMSVPACSRLHVGYDPVAVRITFPHWVRRPDGTDQLVGWQKRALTDPRWPQTPPEDNGSIPKYKNSQGFPKHSTLYNLHRVLDRGRDEVIVVESPMSVLKAESLWDGTDADPLGAVVATFGAKMPEEQIAPLRGFRKVTVWMDDGGAGEKSARHLVESLYKFTRVEHITPEEGFDLGDYNDPDEVAEMIASAEPAFQVLTRWRKADKLKKEQARGRRRR